MTWTKDALIASMFLIVPLRRYLPELSTEGVVEVLVKDLYGVLLNAVVMRVRV